MIPTDLPKLSFKHSAFSLAFALALAGCGGTGQDTGESKNFQQNIRGVAVDGYIARATVFLDYDNNSTRDPWEPFAFTDDSGYYSYNPVTDTDYCAAGADDQTSLYCLRNTRAVAEAVVRVDGGYDVLTGEPFIGQLSRRITLDAADPTPQALVSPLTTLLTNVRTAEDRAVVLTALGIDEADLDVDFMNTGTGHVDGTLLNTTLKIHKAVSILANTLEEHYEEIGSQAGAANDLTSAIYRHLATQLIQREISLDEALQNSGAMAGVLHAAELDAQRIYDRWELELPADSAAGEFLDYSRNLSQTTGLVQAINQLIPAAAEFADADDVKGPARLVETLAIKALRETSSGNTFANAMSFIQQSANAPLVDTLIESLGLDSSDLNNLANHTFTGSDFSSSDNIRDTVQLPTDTQPFSNIAGKQLRVSDLDLGSAPNRLKDSELELYFHGNPGATRGTFNACVKYIKDASSDGTLGDANTRGELVGGYWSLLGADQNAGDSYSLLLNIEFLGAKYQAILKPAGTVVVGAAAMQVIRFDHAGKLRAWHSAAGMESIASLPTTDADCEERLPSRIGI